jgi:hypothetical protein
MENKKNKIEDEHLEIMPKNILIKISGANKLPLLSMKDRGILFTNIYHYHLGKELNDMSPIAHMFFLDLVEVFDFNKEKYKEIVQRNKNNGKKNVKKLDKTQNIPVGYSGIPNETKDRNTIIDSNKDTIINKSIEKIILDSKEQESSIVDKKEKSKGYTSEMIRNEKEYYSKAYSMDYKLLNFQEKSFCYDVAMVVDALGWDRFFFIVFCENSKNVDTILHEFQKLELKEPVMKIIENKTLYLEVIANKSSTKM